MLGHHSTLEEYLSYLKFFDYQEYPGDQHPPERNLTFLGTLDTGSTFTKCLNQSFLIQS